jgi:GNAT superfamily N-acetyltransferase
MTDLEYTARRVIEADAAKLRDIRLEALRDTPEAFGTTYDEALAWSNRQWRFMARDRNFYFALREGRVVGMASGGYNDRSPGTHWLYGMYVTPEARGSAAAGTLVDAVADWARGEGGRELYLHVTDRVARARAFYEKAGFHPTGESMLMTRDPNLTLITMVKPLA